jgi:hypothetical protein
MKTRYVLLKLKPQADDLYLIIAEPGSCEHPDCGSGCDFDRHFYEEKLCTPEILKTARQFAMPGEDDPHFLFEFVALTEGDGASKPYGLFQDVLGKTVDGIDPTNFHEN